MHGDDPSEVTPGQFRRFLVDSPLIRETIGGTFLRPRKASSRRGPSRSAMMVDDEVGFPSCRNLRILFDLCCPLILVFVISRHLTQEVDLIRLSGHLSSMFLCARFALLTCRAHMALVW